MRSKFGEEYSEYADRVPLIIPYFPQGLERYIGALLPSGMKKYIALIAILLVVLVFVGWLFTFIPIAT